LYVESDWRDDLDLLEYDWTAATIKVFNSAGKSTEFEVDVTIGCFDEEFIVPNIEPFSAEYDFAIALEGTV
jgi:hypothetical protein